MEILTLKVKIFPVKSLAEEYKLQPLQFGEEVLYTDYTLDTLKESLEDLDIVTM